MKFVPGEIILLVFAIFVLISVVSCADYCTYFNKYCNTTHPRYDNVLFCASDGKKYTGQCNFFTAACLHNVTVLSIGSNCENNNTVQHHTRPPLTKLPPLNYFEINLYHSIARSIDDRLELSKARGITSEKAKPIYSKQDHTNKIYIRNSDCWAYGLDLTPISPWNSNHGVRKAGTLVTRRHLLWARHYNIPVGTTIRFVALNNTVVERKIAAIKFVNHSSKGHESFWGRDIVVGMLDRDVPDGISFSKVMPKDITEFRPNSNTRLPVLSTDFEEKALVTDFSYYRNTGIGLRIPATGSIENEYYESKIVGDSGNPSFFIINDELVLLFVFTSGGAGGGTSINHYYDEINRLMKEEGSQYQLTPIDLNKFERQGHQIPHIIG